MTTVTDTANTTPTPGQAQQPASPYGARSADDKTLSVSSFVLGLVSIVMGWTFIAPIAGLVVGILALKREPGGRTFATWGIVLNAVMLAGFLVFGLVALVIGVALLPFAFLF
ncbi:DUF4190 domain-containing protein [Compostimonas suwonensis]|uniref:DUF4190 domain-containing protein n=1 Tax=Compostimonas suwonensis TaxID=1048394 RepID=A0A2M9BTZ6_9MICO|nr:DUF4190 domain-containing protein [Compostimonas suwonensis]PJJ61413.1 hypothetical protein CLV54_2358 [Compostimonas suwonensis]